MNQLNLTKDAQTIAQGFIDTGKDLSAEILADYKNHFNPVPHHLQISNKRKKLKAEYEFSLIHNQMLKTKAELFSEVCVILSSKDVSHDIFSDLSHNFKASYDAQVMFIENLIKRMAVKKKAA